VYTLTLGQERDYLHAIVTGENSEAAVRGYMAEILRECASHDCSRLLIEERLEGPRLSAAPVFRIAADGAERAFEHFLTIAYVDTYATGDLMRFAEDVAVNRGVRVRVFCSLSDAEAWLTSTS
jgi:hypothetical protein